MVRLLASSRVGAHTGASPLSRLLLQGLLRPGFIYRVEVVVHEVWKLFLCVG